MKWIKTIFSRTQLMIWGSKTLFCAAPIDTFLIILLFAIRGIIPIASLILIKNIVTTLMQTSDLKTFPLWVVFLWSSLLLLDKVFTPFATILRVRLNEKILAYFHLELMRKANSFQGMIPFERGDLYEQIQQIEHESSRRPMNFVYIFSDGISELVTIVALLLFMIDMTPVVGIAIFLSAIPHAISTTWFERIRWNHTLFSGTHAGKLRWLTSISTRSSTAKELRLFNFENFIKTKYNQYLAEFIENFSSHCWKDIFPALALTLLTVIANTAIFYWMIIEAFNSRLSVAEAVVSLQTFIVTQSMLTNLLQEVAMVQPVLDFFQQFRQFKDQEDTSLDLRRSNKTILELKHEIRFDNVSFSYPDRRQALSNINLSISPGETIALVGENGAGKSTLVKLLMRFYDPTSGNIFLDGVNMKEISPHSWRRMITALFQDYGKYFLTVEENINLGGGAFSIHDDEISEASKHGLFEEVCKQLPHGRKTQLGQELFGTGLSEGEWQKLALSRAYMKQDAQILVLDEPSASLDPRSEHELFESFSKISKNKTALFITHRLGSVKSADRVIMMKEGTIIEDGPHLSLMQNSSQYSAYYALQAKRYSSGTITQNGFVKN